ncbi:methyltransferase domain-containing protein [Maricaulis sp.]|uniref:methyltransferase domain-containing protein n=1 Tax=Maricaulis sp. TaxID=1486257 RepID=UPI002610CC2A|nr:methyltransferase domain-containing protein [Maricaulis sp.]
MSADNERSAMDWEQRFRDDTTPWERASLHPAARDWIDGGQLKPGERVMIPGCGRSPEVVEFAALPMQVVAADLSQTAIAWQGEALAASGVTAELIVADILQWRPAEPFDAIYEQTFLCAIPPRLRGEYEQAVHDWLRPGGALLALFMQKEERGGPPYGCSIEAMHELFPQERWIWPADADFTAYPHPSLNGKPELGGVLIRR